MVQVNIDQRRLARMAMAVLLLAGCSKQVTSTIEDKAMVMRQGVVGQLELAPAGGAFPSGDEVRVADQPIAMAPASSGSSFGSSSGASAMGDVEGASLGDVFFDYDKFTLAPEAQAVLSGDARLLTSRGGVLVISGHCDERGSSAYNLVLGEKRAMSVKHYLQDMGVDAARLRVVSYGKEKPFCQDHNDRCWRDNRRAHLALR